MGFFGRTLSRLDEVKRVLAREPSARQFLAQADELRRQGQVAEAIEVLEKGLEQNPGSVAGHVALGRLLQQGGKLDPALVSYQSALKLDPQNLVALRQTADLYLSRGEKIEAIKKLKLFRGLSPGDREVNELIRQLDDEIAASARNAVRPETQPFAVRTAPVASSPLPPVPAIVVPVPSVPPPQPLPIPEVPGIPVVHVGRPEAAHETVAAATPAPEAVPTGSGGFPAEIPPPISMAPPADGRSELEDPFLEAVRPVEAQPAEAVVPAAPSAFETAEEPAPVGPPVGEPPAPPATAGPPRGDVTETLAELLRSQGHLGEAREAYLALARAEQDPGRVRRFTAIAEEIAGSRARTARGRLEAWAEPFSRLRAPGEVDLVRAVEDLVERLGPVAAVVTDLEGVPVVSAGPRAERDAMENLAAELTAFWKNLRRSRSEIGEGALDSLVLSGTDGTAAVKSITPAYALLMKAGPGVPAGRIRFEAVRAAEKLRPALV